MGAAVSTRSSSSSVLTSSLVLEVEASQQIVWETATEIGTSPTFMEHLLECEIVGDNDDDDDKTLKKGSVIREVRLWRGQPIELLYTITELDPPRCIATATKRSDNVGGNGSARVGTWMFIPVSDTQCQFVSTWAASMDSIRMRWVFLICRCCVLRQANDAILQDMQDIAAEAERRQKTKISEAFEL